MKHCLAAATLTLALAFMASSASAIDPDPAVKKEFDNLLKAIQANDRDIFIANATDAVKKGINNEAMETLHKQIGTRLKKGFEATYLGQLKQAGHQVHLWKVSVKDDGDDLLIRIALKDGKVGGVFFQ